MRVVIVEDEKLAAERLENLLRSIDSRIEVVAVIDTVGEAVQWFGDQSSPDLGFFDIQLADGLSFEIFDQTTVNCPVIFTTAYDTYLLRAFKVNSIDYLLKPIDKEDLEGALQQYERLKVSFEQKMHQETLMVLEQALRQANNAYKSRFVVKVGAHITFVPVEDVAYFFSENKTVWLRRYSDGRKHAIDYTLEQLEELLQPERFFRLNRKYIAAVEAISEAVAYSNSRLQVRLPGVSGQERILVSRERVAAFKAWLDN